MLTARDPVLALLASVALASLAGAWLVSSPNRLVSGEAVSWMTLPWFVCGMASLAPALLALAAIATGTIRRIASTGAVMAPLLAIGIGAAHVPGRAAPGAGFFLGESAVLLAFGHATRGARAARLAASCALVAFAWFACRAGLFAHLSIAVEFAARRAEFAGACARHVLLSSATILLACLIGLPLGLLAHHAARWRGGLFAVLSVVQTIPSIAAFGLLIAPLSALAAHVSLLARLGVAGIGPAPALIALTAYALLPIARNAAQALDDVDPGLREAARGIGLSRAQVLTALDLPLAAPAIVAGIRIASVQTIGLATVASLIGAGGLGVFVFEGVSEYATDLVLLGALPVTALALGADLLFAALARAVTRA